LFERFLLSLARLSITFSRLRFAFSSSLSSGLTANLAVDAPSLVSSLLLQKFSSCFSGHFQVLLIGPGVCLTPGWLSLPPQPALAAHALEQRTLCGHLVLLPSLDVIPSFAEIFRHPSIPSLSVIHDFIGCPF
jgi:hypothetical protein